MAKSILKKVVEEIITPVTPPRKSLRVLFVATESTPYATVGGIGRVMFFLPRALNKLGHDVRIFMPKYGKIDQEKFKMDMVLKELKVPTGEQSEDLICNVKSHQLPESPKVYFLENMEYYEKRANEYGYVDDHPRWWLLCKGMLEFLRHDDWLPDVIHCNDWQTGLIPQFLKTDYKDEHKFRDLVTVYTIHNMFYQGNFDHRFMSDADSDDGKSNISSFYSERLLKINGMRRGIMYSDLVTTVSETYAKEILKPEYGEKLDELLRENRTKLFGILNGIDYDEFNPSTDKIIRVNFNVNSIGFREKNKMFLQDEFGLPQNPQVPLFAISGRLEDQKGLDLLMETADPLLAEYDIQLIVNGGGDNKYRFFFTELQNRYPEKVATNLVPNFTLPRHIFAGADIILLPAKFEPCGLVQMEAMRYGAVPVARATGGLADTVEDGVNGFIFKKFDRWACFATIIRALETYKDKTRWKQMVTNAMKKDFSWTESAKQYAELYYRGLDLKKQKETSKSHIGYYSE